MVASRPTQTLPTCPTLMRCISRSSAGTRSFHSVRAYMFAPLIRERADDSTRCSSRRPPRRLLRGLCYPEGEHCLCEPMVKSLLSSFLPIVHWFVIGVSCTTRRYTVILSPSTPADSFRGLTARSLKWTRAKSRLVLVAGKAPSVPRRSLC